MATQRINIFAEKQATRTPTDIVGRFRSGMQTAAGRPMSISEWRVTSGDRVALEQVGEILGVVSGPQEWSTKSQETLELMTTSSTVRVILDGEDSIRSGLILWGRGNQPIRKCDGVTQLEPNAGEPCQCPSDMNERREAAKSGLGCDVNVQLTFALADGAGPSLGLWRFQSSSWGLAREINTAHNDLAKIESGRALAELSLVQVSYETRAGQRREYTKPTITILGEAPDA